ncbi:restriction endonuclease subunit S [Mammaliicoccus sciuri]|uniref:restriction endonuclease subunit S n=1 Tax=Mammaliicoccus sciuri TaxID=1296 RepID=UPI0037A24068
MTNEMKKVPELRFPEFDGEWEEKKLGDIAIIKGRLGWKGLKNEEYVENGYAYLVAGRHIKNGIIDWHSADQINKFRYDESPEISLEKNDIIFSKDGSLGNPAIIQSMLKPATINGTMMLVRVQAQKLNPNFFYQILLSDHFKRLIHLKVSGSSIPHLFQADMKEFTIKTTKIDEQQKIGEFLSKLDRQIELEEQKLAKLEEQKKGYMQKIFSQELRFKDENGNEYPEWEDYVLGEIGFSYTGLSGKTKEDFGHGNASFITYMNVFKNTIANINMTEKVEIKENEKQNKVNYKDILFTTSSEVPEETGMASVWLYEKDNVYLNSFCFGFRVTSHNVNPIYLSRYLRSEKMRKQITLLSQGSTRFNISKKEVLKLNIDVPELREQNKIVEYLSCHDSRIEGQKNKINVLKQRKQGLLQKMFI